MPQADAISGNRGANRHTGAHDASQKDQSHPISASGETIREDYLKPLGMSAHKLALDLRVPAIRMTEIGNGRRGITADTALRLTRYFNTTAKFWLNLQASYDPAKAFESSSERSSAASSRVKTA